MWDILGSRFPLLYNFYITPLFVLYGRLLYSATVQMQSAFSSTAGARLRNLGHGATKKHKVDLL